MIYIISTICFPVKIDYLKAYNHRLANKLRWELCSYLEALTGSSSCHWSPKKKKKTFKIDYLKILNLEMIVGRVKST